MSHLEMPASSNVERLHDPVEKARRRSQTEGQRQAKLAKIASGILIAGLICWGVAAVLLGWYYYEDDPEAALTRPVVAALATSVGIGLMMFGARMKVAVGPIVDQFTDLRWRSKTAF